MLGEVDEPHFAYFSRALLTRSRVIDHPVRVLRIEMRAADEHHQMIGLSLRRLSEVKQIARLQGADVAADAACVQADEGLCVGELRIAYWWTAGDAKQLPTVRLRPGRRTDVGKRWREGKRNVPRTFGCVRAQRLTIRKTNQRRAVDNFRRRSFELRVSEKNKPRSKGGLIGRVR